MKNEKDKLSKIEVSGNFLTKETKGKDLVILSDEVSVCILNLSPSKTSFHYSLYLSNKDKNKNEKWEHLSFDIKPEMNLTHFINNDKDCFQWFTKENIYILQITFDELDERKLFNFWKILEQCLCSIDKNIPIDRARLTIKKTSIKYVKEYGEIDDIDKHTDNMIKKLEIEINKKAEEEKLIQAIKNMQITPPKIETVINLEVSKNLFRAEGELFNYDTDKDESIKLNEGKKLLLTIYHLDSQKYEYAVCSQTLDGLLISFDKINEDICGQILDNENLKFFCWISHKCYTNIIGDCLGFSFDKKEDAKELSKILDKCFYETKNKQPYENIDEDNRKILEKATDYNNIDCFSSDEDEDKNEKVENSETSDNSGKLKKNKKNREEILDLDENFKEIDSSKEILNKFCINSLSNDRTFCITDNNEIVVYKANEQNDTFEKLSSMPVVQEYENNNNICFSHGLLYKSENNILLLDENNPFILYQYDLPKEKIVNEWKTEKISISDVCSFKKTAQTTDEPLIYGVNSKSVFTLDERVNNKNNIVDIKTYNTKNYANKIMSNSNGQFVTGSIKGDVRLYDKMGIKAKNLFSFYGDPIRYIDISSDDQYILLTCDKYLILINSGCTEENKNSFLKTIKTIERKTPLRLQIKTTDIVKYGLNNANYTPAKFNMNKNGENNIITSLGEYIIIWNYNDIRKGKIASYKIKKVNDLVIDNDFKLGKGNKIVITMPTKIRIQNQKKIFG